MLTDEEHRLVLARAYVPEHLPDYVGAVSGARPVLIGGFLCYLRRSRLIFIGYPIDENAGDMHRVFREAVERYRPASTAVMAPDVRSLADEEPDATCDHFYELTLPLRGLSADVAYMIRRARRELAVRRAGFSDEHQRLVDAFVATRAIGEDHRYIFSRLPAYLAAAPEARLLEARKQGRLAAFAVGDFTGAATAFFQFSFRNEGLNVPGASDLLLAELVAVAEQQGKRRLNLGLGINPGNRRFKEKWGGVPFLKHETALVQHKRLGWPRWLERRLNPIHDKITQRKSMEKRRWRLLQVESAIACNLKCVMCPWRQIAKGAARGGLMSEEMWAAIRPHLKEVTSVDFTGGGEPLLQPRLAEWIEEAKAAGCETGFLSNGLLLNRDRLQRILAAGLDWLCISMDGADGETYNRIRVGSDFDRVCENVARIARLRSSQGPKTMINFVLMDLNAHQLKDVVRLADKLGVDQVNFKQCDVIRADAGKGFGLFSDRETRLTRKLQKQLTGAQRLARKLGVKTTAFPFTPKVQAVCDQDPRSSMFIRHDGAVGPCINQAIGGATTFLGQDAVMPTVHYGRLPQEDLVSLWESEKCRFFRERFEERSRRYEESLTGSLIGAAGASRERAEQEARDCMPEPPEGCNVCHYLYNI